MIAGIDEAGRGPVLGPMVIAGVMVTERGLRKLRKIGVRDSKQLTRERRTEFAEAIRAIPDIAIAEEVVTPLEIDEAVFDRSVNLNGLEIRRMARIIDRLLPGKAYIDLIGHSAERFTMMLFQHARHRPQIIAKHGADEKYAVTAAASIIAKVRRDAEVDCLKEIYGPIGSGYCHDPITRHYMKSARDGDYIRKSWSTYKRGTPASPPNNELSPVISRGRAPIS